MGWIGLVLTMLLFLMVLYQGIHYYFRMKNEEYKKYMVATTCAIFRCHYYFICTGYDRADANSIFYFWDDVYIIND